MAHIMDTAQHLADEERREKLRRDPRVVVRRRGDGARTPFQPAIRVTEQVDVLELIGRRDDDEPDPPRDR